MIGNIKAVPGARDALVEILLNGSGSMPGCLSYVVAADPADPDGVWVSEVWTNAESHKASLQLESVKAAITKGMPLIAGFESHVETEPRGGIGISS